MIPTAPRSTVATSKEKFYQRPVFVRLLALVVFFSVWQVGGTLSSSLSVPTLTETAGAWWHLVVTGALGSALWLSMVSMLIGLGLAIVFGILIGLLMGWYQRLEEAMDLYISLLMVLPMMSIVPIIIAFLGLSMASRVMVVFLFAVITIIVNTVAGVKQVDPTLVEMANSFGATRPQIFRRILLPGSMPSIVAGLRLGTGRAFVGMISSEMLVSAAGIGSVILEYSAKFKPEFVFATLITIIAIALMVSQLLRQVEFRLLAWMQTQSH